MVQIKGLSTNKIILFIVLTITIMLYIKTLSFDFVNWDDDENIRTNIQYRELSFDNIKYHFDHSRYKAIAIWSLMLDNKVFGKKADMYHLHNLFLHVVNILLVFICLLKFSRKETAALIGATLFALHPAFVEPVAWVTGRKDLLFLIFSLLSVLAYRQYVQKGYNTLWLLVVMVTMYLASLAKIQAFTLPLIFWGIDWYYNRRISFFVFADKILLFFLITDKWVLFGLTGSILVLMYYYRMYFSKHQHISLIIYGFQLFMLLVFVYFNKRFRPQSIINTASEKIIINVFIYVISAIILFLALKYRKKIIQRIALMHSGWKLAMIITPLLIFIAAWYRGLIYKSYLFHKFTMHLWTFKPENENYFFMFERLILAPNALLYYILRFFLFKPQNPMISYPARLNGSLPSSMYINAIIVYILLAIILFFLIKYFRRKKEVVLGVIWFLASISIVLHIIPIEGKVLAADRYAYPSYIGLFLLMGIACDYLIHKSYRNVVISALVVISLALGIVTFINLDTWKNSFTLWQKSLRVSPDNDYAMYSLSLAFFTDKRNPEKALAYLDKAISIKDNNFQYYNNRGRIRFAIYDFDGALADFNKSVELDSNSFVSYNNRGATHQQLCNFKEALSDYDKALNLKPDYIEAQNNRDKVLRLINLDSIVINNSISASYNTNEIIEFIDKTAQNYINKKQLDKGELYLNKGIMLYPKYLKFHEKLAVMYQLNKEYDKSLAAYNNGLSSLPENATLLYGRALLYIDKGDTSKACTDLNFVVNNGFPDAQKIIDQVCGKQ